MNTMLENSGPTSARRSSCSFAGGFIVLTLPTGLLFGWLAKRSAVKR